ncbi:methylenetetrahydrofolate reductase [NAD(P)H] [Bifidobacterium mongoliense]|uniref:methylenetetrahydrofolate reductase [NAD(P)H] n=1 Tax=Bifidobacterium mongoliense TaxID=518643 RepID=UPI00264802BC|nr:methylenetetrahydrofolate reductase [NAD(P)H] [Bifidobacterium mongoliense]MDN6025810.1 methylenetetrahydrofolate reductase [NAD(P)H] [Bifidobacterium mongoliense]MDN6051497.1 methylenetetrahydrofolate reductase [NAD(P)H] [Bifidobacterium mongoliense]MDN6719503.1 methylenetetrahydrofolate reductase [NAD(P)H] [Bifidobacterium mongoliense]
MHRPAFSLEVFPPRRHAPIGTIYDTLDGLEDVDPDFISVTYGTGRSADRTATLRISRTIHDEYRIPVVAHLTAQYLDRNQADETLDAFEAAGVHAVLALRGDRDPDRPPTDVFAHASDLTAYIADTHPDMTIYGACYPECHPQSKNRKDDIGALKLKVDAGAKRLISQLFYDDDDFLSFLEIARASGIAVPIEAGIMPVTDAAQVGRMVRLCSSRVPRSLSRILERWGDDPSALREAGIIYASQQITDLVAQGVDGIHLYTMNRPAITRRIWANTRGLFATGTNAID